MKKPLSIGILVSSLGMLALLLLLASYATLYGVTRTDARQTAEDSAKGAAVNSAHNVTQLIALLNASLSGQLADPRLAGLLGHSDAGAVLQEENRLTQAIPQAWLVRVLPEHADTPDEVRLPRMGFSDLNLVRAAAAGESIQPGVHLANSPDAHLAMAARLAGGGGVLLASWPQKLLEAALNADGSCAIELRQDSISLAYRGDPACKEQAASGSIAITQTPWEVDYWVSTRTGDNLSWFVGGLLGSVLLMAGGTAGLVFWLYAKLRHDRKSLVGMIDDLFGGSLQGEHPFQLSEFLYLSQDVLKLKRNGRDAPPAYAPAAPPAIDIRTRPHDEDMDAESIVEMPLRVAVEPAKAEAASGNATDMRYAEIFRSNDIRGIAGETLTADMVYALGLAIGTEMEAHEETHIALARDGRLSSPELSQCLAQGLVDSGRTVINLGEVPTPLLYYATHALNAQSGVMLTGGHNPPEYNGLKIIIAGHTLMEGDIQALRQRVEQSRFTTGNGKISSYNLIPEYIERVVGDTQLGRNLKVVVDCGNGVAAAVAPSLLRAIGCQVIELFCDIDGEFPNHPADPGQPANLGALIGHVLESQADLGIAYDADGDRLGLVDCHGRIICPDRLMMLFATDVLSREPGADIIYDVKCSRHLPSYIVKNGGRPLMWKSGHATMKAKIRSSGAMLAGDMNGHIYFQERWFGFDDAIYASARIIEILSNESDSTAAVFAQLPHSVSTPELQVFLPEGENVAIMADVLALAHFPDARVSTLDGLRVEFLDGWGLVRASGSMPALSFRFEADNDQAMATLQQQFENLLRQARPNLELPFGKAGDKSTWNLLVSYRA